MFRFNLKSKLIETALAIRQHTCDELQTDDDDPAYRHAAIRLDVVDVAFFFGESPRSILSAGTGLPASGLESSRGPRTRRLGVFAVA